MKNKPDDEIKDHKAQGDEDMGNVKRKSRAQQANISTSSRDNLLIRSPKTMRLATPSMATPANMSGISLDA